MTKENTRKKTGRRESKKEKTERALRILTLFDKNYPEEQKCYLNHDSAWQLLFATIMSAQCTDERVNQVTQVLYQKYPSVEAFANASYPELCEDIRQTGFFHNKAKNLIGCAKMLLSEYNGEVPSEIGQLIQLPGVGRKTANVIRGNIFHVPSIVVDTHVKRISGKLGLTDETDPVKIEFDLMKLLPEDHWISVNINLIRLGRTICYARHPYCEECFLKEECMEYQNAEKRK